MKKTAILMLAVLLSGTAGTSAGAGDDTRVPPGSFGWLLGTWEATRSWGTIVETWSTRTDGVLAGASFSVKNGDTTLSESTRLEFDSAGVWFVAAVSHNASEVRFRLVAHDSSGAHFENPEHDFPTSVHYRPAGTDSLYAWIEGDMNGKQKRMDFKYRRVPSLTRK